MHIVALACCRNRRQLTLSAISDLYGQNLSNDIKLSIVLVDDASSDGTSQSVLDLYPNVELVDGSGDLYWAGGMRFGWQQVVSHMDFDYLFVFNDDTRFFPDALSHLTNVAKQCYGINSSFALVGSVTDPITGNISYGGRIRSSRLHPLKFANLVFPNGHIQTADVCNMNAVLLSRNALKNVGFLSPFFIHSGADFEYCLRLRKSRGSVFVAPKIIGTCAPNPSICLRKKFTRTIRDRLDYLFDIKREPPRQRWEMYRRHGGPYWLLLFFIPYLTIWFSDFRKL